MQRELLDCSRAQLAKKATSDMGKAGPASNKEILFPSCPSFLKSCHSSSQNTINPPTVCMKDYINIQKHFKRKGTSKYTEGKSIVDQWIPKSILNTVFFKDGNGRISDGYLEAVSEYRLPIGSLPLRNTSPL